MLLDNIDQSFLDRAVELVKSGHGFVFILDNIDWEEKAHDMQKDNQNTSVHAMATSIVFSQIPNEELPDSQPQQDSRKCNVNQLIKVTASGMDCIRNRYQGLIPWQQNSSLETVYAKYGWLHMNNSIEFSLREQKIRFASE